MRNYFKLTLFLVLIGKFDQSQTFNPDWPELGHISAKQGQTRRKRDSQEPSVVLHGF